MRLDDGILKITLREVASGLFGVVGFISYNIMTCVRLWSAGFDISCPCRNSTMPEARPPDIDLVIAFRATNGTTISKETRKDARKAEQQYKHLLDTLTTAGLKAVGRRGESLGHILVFVLCPPKFVEDLVRRERLAFWLTSSQYLSDHCIQPFGFPRRTASLPCEEYPDSITSRALKARSFLHFFYPG